MVLSVGEDRRGMHVFILCLRLLQWTSHWHIQQNKNLKPLLQKGIYMSYWQK